MNCFIFLWERDAFSDSKWECRLHLRNLKSISRYQHTNTRTRFQGKSSPFMCTGGAHAYICALHMNFVNENCEFAYDNTKVLIGYFFNTKSKPTKEVGGNKFLFYWKLNGKKHLKRNICAIGNVLIHNYVKESFAL